ncbi:MULTISPECIES: DUF624 domain-containing protein [Gracilibacillus]|uniref:DUF624 domain-containing protein n=1 Tax=Gracilibacillus TaxID=74385 RepID=UPI00137243DC|nr:MULTISPECIES: DUF624 domain-containing protein [Gracilibacillus]
MNRTFVFSDWLWELLQLHLLWLWHILKGAVVLGVFPATAALYAIVRHWMLHRPTEKLSHLFKTYVQDNYWLANKIGYTLLFLTVMMMLNFLYVPLYSEVFRLIMYALLTLFSIILLIEWIYFIPVIIHWEGMGRSYFVLIFQFGVQSLSAFLLQLLFAGIFLWIVYLFPALLLLFGMIPIAFLQMAVINHLYERLQSNSNHS